MPASAALGTIDTMPLEFRVPRLIAVGVAAVFALAACATATDATARPSAPAATSTPAPSLAPSAALPASPSPTPSPSFDRSALSIDDPASLWVVVNKARALTPLGYAPELVDAGVPNIAGAKMRPDAASAIAQMFSAAAAEGAGGMQIQNSFRSFETQTSLHDRIVAQKGAALADAQSARAGHSEHQTGWSADIAALPENCTTNACFADTPQGKWLAANSWRFGFIVRYPADKIAVTGYIYEPWHFRYVGVELATEMHRTGVTTLEEFFGLPPAPDYTA